MAIEDSIDDLISGKFLQSSPLSEIESYIYLVLMLVGIGIIAFFGIRYISTLQQRPSGEYHGEYQFQIANFNRAGSNTIQAHLSKAKDQFSPKMVSDLMRLVNSEQQLNPESKIEFEKLVNRCYIFNGNVSDFKKDDIIKGSKKSIFLINVDIGEREFYREEAEGHFTITTASFHKWTRNVQCISGQSVTMGNSRGEPVDVYLVNVHGNDLTRIHDTVLSDHKFMLKTFVFPEELDVEILGKLALFLPTLVELYNKVSPSHDEINRLRDKIHEWEQKFGALLRENEIAKDRAIRKSILGHEHPFVQQLKGVAWGWQLVTGFMGMIGYYIADTQSALQGVPIISNPIVFGALMVIVMVIVRYTFENRQPLHKQSQENSESEGKVQT